MTECGWCGSGDGGGADVWFLGVIGVVCVHGYGSGNGWGLRDVVIF